MEALQAVSAVKQFFDAFNALKNAIKAVASSVARHGTPEADFIDAATRYFEGGAHETAFLRVTGVLTEYIAAPANVLYSPVIASRATERVVGYTPHPLAADGFARDAKTTTGFAFLSPPGRVLPPLRIGNDAETVRVAWLYPSAFRGLAFQPKPKGSRGALTAEGVFDVDAAQRPIMCIMPTDGSLDVHLNAHVELFARPLTARSAAEHGQLLFTELSPFILDVLSNTLRPAEERRTVFALDLRTSDARVRPIRPLEQLPTAVSVEALLSAKGELTASAVTQIVDAVPDRIGMGAMRLFAFEGSDTESILSNGRIRWLIHRDYTRMSALVETDVLDRERYARDVTQLVAHWQAWQKAARNKLRTGAGIELSIQPVNVWDPRKAAQFHPDGVGLRPDVESALLSADPEVRESVDWLRIATGR